MRIIIMVFHLFGFWHVFAWLSNMNYLPKLQKIPSLLFFKWANHTPLYCRLFNS